jgi:hypothetical protein
MKCFYQKVIGGSCPDETSRLIKCKIGYANTCMKFCNEKCPQYSAVQTPASVPAMPRTPAAGQVPPARGGEIISGGMVYRTGNCYGCGGSGK